ncbi:MAG: dephospho-CoA kinase [Anaerolineae bacterium]|nr:dephospho-CoA kinase [Anaerolineae bacterium]
MSADRYVIGLTGNIAVGKSVVRQMLQHLGAYTIDADQLSHQATAPGAPAYLPTVEMFGKFILNPDGTVNRSLLGNIVFTYPDALTKLEAIIHPVVGQAIAALLGRAKQRVIVIEAIKLLESENLRNIVDAIWVVDASAEAQIKRLVERRKMSEEEARRRILAQRPQADKIAKANVIITNDGNVEETWKQVQAAWNKLPAKARGVAETPLAAVKPLGGEVKKSTGMHYSVAPGFEIIVRRGMPANTELIAAFITQATKRDVSRMDVMMAFGQKSYLLVQDMQGRVVALAGWQVENLITRVDEFYVALDVPREPVVRALVNAVEEASRELQSEVSFVFLPKSTPADIGQSFLGAGYQPMKLDEIKFPAWREAAHELLTSDNIGLMKQLRADRVMKPI